MSYYYLFLDDARKRSDVTWVNLPFVSWEIVRNYSQFVTTIEKFGIPKFVTFDHDLAEAHYNQMMYDVNPEKYNKLYSTFKEKTGFDCSKWLVKYCSVHNLPFPDYTVHSMNPIGKMNIISYIESYKKSIKL